MAEALTRLDGKFTPSRGASASEKFRAACASARRQQAETPDSTIHQIVTNWRAVLEDEKSDAGEMVVLGRTFPKAKKLNFYADLLSETTVSLEALDLARELLVLAFEDRRRWSGRGCQKTLFFEGKHWTLFTAGGLSSFVPVEEQMAFDQALARFPSAKKLQALIDRLTSLSEQPPSDAPQGWCCQFQNVGGKAPAWRKPLNPDQTLAVAAISKCGSIWDIATNLWSLFNLPADREGFSALV